MEKNEAQPREFSKIRRHWYIMAVEVIYTNHNKNPGTPGARSPRETFKLNVILPAEKRNIRASTMQAVKDEVMRRTTKEKLVKPIDIHDYVILNISSMGHMSEAEYFENSDVVAMTKKAKE